MTLHPLALAIMNSFKKLIGIDKPELKPGDQVDLKGVGDRFSGTDSVDSVTHDIGETNFQENIETKRNDSEIK
jgi:hypothetical protein